VIRSLAPDELAWFLSQSFAFLGHSDPYGLARRMLGSVREVDVEARRSFIFIDTRPKAGAHVLIPNIQEDQFNLLISNIWYEENATDLLTLLETLLTDIDHKAAYISLHNFSNQLIQDLEPFFKGLGFRLEEVCELSFDLAEVPPLGLPVVLEAWDYASDAGFKELYQTSEGVTLSDQAWSYLKRCQGGFDPDVWFIARETLDQPPVGYAFYASKSSSLDSTYALIAAGVLPEHRFSSEMLRRVVISSMLDLASRSPFGRIETTLPIHDRKLIQIFESLGFNTKNRYKHFVNRPV
jgi:hypothetical protein